MTSNATTLSNYLSARLAHLRAHAALVALEGVEHANAFAVIQLSPEIPEIATLFDTDPGTVTRMIGKMTKKMLGAKTVKAGNRGPGFHFTSLT